MHGKKPRHSTVVVHSMNLLLIALCIAAYTAPTVAQVNPQQLLQFAGKQLQTTAAEVKNPNLYPLSTIQNNGTWLWQTTGPSAWTSGFFPSSLWQLYNFSGDTMWKSLAESWTADISTQENNTSTHDVGFMVFYSFARGYELTGRLDYKAIALQAAHSLSTRYSPIVGCIRSWNGPGFQVIVDNMLNLELLFWAAANGGPQIYYEMAVNHSDHTATNHIRKAGNSWHLVVYDPDTGVVLSQSNSPQGLDSPNGTWARGQGWAVYGFTMAYRYTKLQRYLDTAQLCANWFISNVPTDWVPKWDFAAPIGSPKDSSAASITASGLLELSKYVDEIIGQKYKQVAINILESLASTAYLGNSSITPAILLHGVGSLPDNSQIDVSLTYGDYYFIEALLRLSSS